MNYSTIYYKCHVLNFIQEFWTFCGFRSKIPPDMFAKNKGNEKANNIPTSIIQATKQEPNTSDQLGESEASGSRAWST